MLDVSPQTQILVEQEAARDGVSVDALFQRTLAPRSWRSPSRRRQATMQSGPRPWPTFTKPRRSERSSTPQVSPASKPNSWGKSAALEETTRANTDWQAHEQGINAARRETGESLLCSVTL